MKTFFLLSYLLLFSLFAFGQFSTETKCSILKKGNFKYLDAIDTSAYFSVGNNGHTEYLHNGKYQIQSKVTWLNDCQYKMVMLSSTIPDFPFHPGDVMIVTINKIEDGIIYYTSETSGNKWQGRLVKMK